MVLVFTNHSVFLTLILFVVSSNPHMFFSYIHPVFVFLGLGLYKDIFLLSFNSNYDSLFFQCIGSFRALLLFSRKSKPQQIWDPPF